MSFLQMVIAADTVVIEKVFEPCGEWLGKTNYFLARACFWTYCTICVIDLAIYQNIWIIVGSFVGIPCAWLMIKRYDQHEDDSQNGTGAMNPNRTPALSLLRVFYCYTSLLFISYSVGKVAAGGDWESMLNTLIGVSFTCGIYFAACDTPPSAMRRQEATQSVL